MRVGTQPTRGGGNAEGESAKQAEASWSYGSAGEPHSSEGVPESRIVTVSKMSFPLPLSTK